MMPRRLVIVEFVKASKVNKAMTGHFSEVGRAACADHA